MKKWVLATFFILASSFRIEYSQASERFSQCTYNFTANKITGSNVDDLTPIASISKLMTSYWALSTYSSFHRFKDQIFFQEIANDVFDVHIQGSLNPFFNNDSFNWLVLQLNSRQIFRVRNLTFDKNFFYMHNLDQLAAYDAIDFKVRYSRTAEALKTSLNHLKNTYSETKLKFQQAIGKKLPENITLSVEHIRRGNAEAPPSDSFTLFSAPVVDLIAQMNKTSNNHVADFFFESLGGIKAFNSFMKNNLSLTEKEIRFINGSGGPYLDKTSQKKFYNYASCRTVIQVILALQQKLVSENLNLWDAMTAVQPEASHSEMDLNPLNDYYNSDLTAYAVVGKTGTINPIIGLAGLISTTNGPFLLAEFMKTKGSGEWNPARSQILKDLESFITSNGGPKILALKNKVFLSFSE